MPVRGNVISRTGESKDLLSDKTLNDSLANLIDLIIRLGNNNNPQLALNNNFE